MRNTVAIVLFPDQANPSIIFLLLNLLSSCLIKKKRLILQGEIDNPETPPLVSLIRLHDQLPSCKGCMHRLFTRRLFYIYQWPQGKHQGVSRNIDDNMWGGKK
jgi:hypothetical protein